MTRTRSEVLCAFDHEGMDYAILQGYADDCDDPEIAALVAAAKIPLAKLEQIFQDEYL